MVSGFAATFYRQSFLLLKDVIIILRSGMKRRLKACIIIASPLERNMLCMLFVNLVVHYMIATFANSIENMALICCFIL